MSKRKIETMVAMLVAIFALSFAMIFSSQVFAQGTGQNGCYFGEGDNCYSPPIHDLPQPNPPTPPQPNPKSAGEVTETVHTVDYKKGEEGDPYEYYGSFHYSLENDTQAPVQCTLKVFGYKREKGTNKLLQQTDTKSFILNLAVGQEKSAVGRAGFDGFDDGEVVGVDRTIACSRQ